MNELKKIRLDNNITQLEAAEILKISRRSYQKYEALVDEEDEKLKYLIYRLKELMTIDENNGLLTIDKIKSVVEKVMRKYDIKSCYLFGSYAKGYAKETSDVDLLIDSEITGLDFYGLVEELRNGLHKKIDLLTIKSISNNSVMLTEILKDGIKIYG